MSIAFIFEGFFVFSGGGVEMGDGSILYDRHEHNKAELKVDCISAASAFITYSCYFRSGPHFQY